MSPMETPGFSAVPCSVHVLKNNPRNRIIVVVEDDPDAIVLLEHAAHRAGIPFPIKAITRVDQAILFLKESAEPESELDSPGLVLLDMSVSGKSTFEVLRAVRANEATRSLPVAVFSGSINMGAIGQAYEEGANAFIPKPHGLAELGSTLKAISKFWIRPLD